MASGTNGIRLIITGSTGMVGEGVLHECLQHPAVEAVLIINRKPLDPPHPPDVSHPPDASHPPGIPHPPDASHPPGTAHPPNASHPLGVPHPRLKEIVHSDFYDLTAIEPQLRGYNACYFCLGVSSMGMSAADYYKVTYTLTMAVASTLCRLNPDMVFIYVSGAGTDRSEKGRSRWARVKGKTENDLMRLPFRHVYAFRPGFIRPTRGLAHAHSFYRYINWLFPIGRALYPNGFVTLSELGLAMIHLTLRDDPTRIVDGKDIIALAAAPPARPPALPPARPPAPPSA